ncbi:MAG: sulfur carrier protein ThiS [Thermaerobacter sp.]|jgi:sulfur carrier protein|nr:sulfur carrier protein ThiS [Thermaerobacter sp.]
MEIVLNGQRRQVSEDSNLSALLTQLAARPEMVTVELNGRILDRSEIADAPLKPGDQVKILHFMGGGR